MNERDIELRNMALPLELRNINGSNTIGGYAMVWGVIEPPTGRLRRGGES